MRFLKNRNFIVTVVTLTLLGMCAALSGIFPRPRSVKANVQEIVIIEKDQVIPEALEPTSQESDEQEISEEVYEVILVHVAGSVENPGVYSLPEGSRVINAVEIAGGMSKKAAGNYVNLAMPVSDGQQVYVPSVDEIKPKKIAEEPKNRLVVTNEEVTKKNEEVIVNINTAGTDELTLLPGIGLATAKSIISFRESNGLFNSTDELIYVSGIGEAKLSKLYPYVKVR